jgi:hypothetical protein
MDTVPGMPIELVPQIGKFYTIEEINEEADTALVNVPQPIRLCLWSGHYVDLPAGQYQLNPVVCTIAYFGQCGGKNIGPTVQRLPDSGSVGKIFAQSLTCLRAAPPGMYWEIPANPLLPPYLRPIPLSPDTAAPFTTPETGYSPFPSTFGRYIGDIGGGAVISAAAQVALDQAEQLDIETNAGPEVPGPPSDRFA